jgi:hypothetical protein
MAPTISPGGFVPASPANAATMFVPGTGAGPARHPPTPMQAPTMLAPPQAPVPAPPVPVQPPPMQAPPMTKPLLQAQPPIIGIPKAQPPPYLASQSAARANRPVEPWRDSLRLLMFLWGVGLLVAFVTPLRTQPQLQFGWSLILDGEGSAKLRPLMLIATGVLSMLVAGIPMQPAARGLFAAVLGLAGVIVPIAIVGAPPWQGMVLLVATLVLVPGLILRSEYLDATLPRVLVTIGVLSILLVYLLPADGAIPLVGMFKALIDAPGAAKIDPALALGEVAIVALSLLAWLPGPVTGGAKLWAWLLILWALLVQMTTLIISGGLGEAITSSPNATLVAWIAGGASTAAVAIGSAYLVLIGYGLASVVGKQLE